MEGFRIRLEDLRFYSRIGVLEQERIVGNEFSVDVLICMDAKSFVPEDLSSSISYADVYEKVAEIMKEEWMLLESVAKSIGDSLKENWKQISEVSVKVTKLSAPISGIQGKCSVEYTA